MVRIRNLFAALGAVGLAVAQPAAAQDGDGGMFEDSPGAAPVVGLIALVGVIFAIMALTGDGGDDLPTSP